MQDWLELDRAFSSGSGEEEIGYTPISDDINSQIDLAEQMEKRDSP